MTPEIKKGVEQNVNGIVTSLNNFSLSDISLLDIAAPPVAIALTYITMRVVVMVLGPVMKKIMANSLLPYKEDLIDKIKGPISLLISLVLLFWLSQALNIDIEAAQLFRGTFQIMMYFGCAWLIFRIIDTLADHQMELYQKRRNRNRANLIPLGRRILKAFLAIVVFVFILQNAGINVGALIAGLGIGGIAIALAAQKTIENLFGGVVMVFDQPLRVGDYVRAEGIEGTVEDITWRSTRIRTLDRTLIAVPNADMSQMKIENFAKRERIRIATSIGVRYETSSDQMRYLITELKKMVYAHPKLDQNDVRVRLSEFGAYSINIQFVAYVLTTEYDEFLAVREDVLLRVMDIVKQSGADFAFPSQTLYLERSSGFDADKQKAAEKETAKLRKSSEILLPDIPDKTLEKLKESLEFPPAGSAEFKKRP